MTSERVYFNGIDLYANGFKCLGIGNTPNPIFGGSKTLSKSRAINSLRYTKNKLVREPLTFSLQFVLIEDCQMSPWTWEKINLLYSILDVDTYKKLYFGDQNIKKTKAYYNALPFVGNQSDLNIFIGDMGYIEVSFECDAGNAWVDEEVTWRRTTDTSAIAWNLPIGNISNVRNDEGNYRVYPKFKIKLTDPNCTTVEFRAASTTDDDWFVIEDLTPNDIVEVDGVNQQYYSANGDNIFNKMRKNSVKFPWLDKGDTVIYHRGIQGTTKADGYEVTMYASYPVNLAGILADDIIIEPDKPSEKTTSGFGVKINYSTIYICGKPQEGNG